MKNGKPTGMSTEAWPASRVPENAMADMCQLVRSSESLNATEPRPGRVRRDPLERDGVLEVISLAVATLCPAATVVGAREAMRAIGLEEAGRGRPHQHPERVRVRQPGPA